MPKQILYNFLLTEIMACGTMDFEPIVTKGFSSLLHNIIPDCYHMPIPMNRVSGPGTASSALHDDVFLAPEITILITPCIGLSSLFDRKVFEFSRMSRRLKISGDFLKHKGSQIKKSKSRSRRYIISQERFLKACHYLIESKIEGAFTLR